MKVILSRKCFDSSYGGHPNLILPNKRMLPLPIPSNEDELTYKDLILDKSTRYSDYMKKLFKKVKGYDSIESVHCHLDPDIIYDIIPNRHPDWRGAFGQKGGAQTVLKNQNVEEDDLFLFFGWFNHVVETDKKIKYKKGSGFHAIFGYLQIGEIVNPRANPHKWLNAHPHMSESRKNLESNCIYVARENTSWNETIPGYGTFLYDESLKLTKDGYSRSRWDLPDFFRDLKITYHSPSSWKKDYFQSACIGQEFVVEENTDVQNWAQRLIEENTRY